MDTMGPAKTAKVAKGLGDALVKGSKEGRGQSSQEQSSKGPGGASVASATPLTTL